jgi:multiple antibiotic resistance protein
MIKKALKDFLTLWVTLELDGTVVLFASLSVLLSALQRLKVALKSVVYPTLFLLATIVVGQVLLTALQVQLISLQVAGGLILFLFSVQKILASRRIRPRRLKRVTTFRVTRLRCPPSQEPRQSSQWFS